MQIGVILRLTGAGKRALSFAGHLFGLLSGQQLHVFVQDRHMAAGTQIEPAMSARIEARVRDNVSSRTGLSLDRLAVHLFGDERTAEFPDGSMIVDHNLALLRNDVHVICPFDEVNLDCRGESKLCIPFGDGDHGLLSAQLAYPLAHRLNKSVVLYHTTWRDEHNRSPRAEDHMCDEARAVWQRLKRDAESQGVRVESVIEMAADVAEGVLMHTVPAGIGLLAVSRDLSTLGGCYVEQWLLTSPVPVLLVGRKE